MRIQIHLKDPDGVHESLKDAFTDAVKDENPKLSDKEVKVIARQRQEDASGALEKWIAYGEYVTIEIDTEAGTAVVLPKRG